MSVVYRPRWPYVVKTAGASALPWFVLYALTEFFSGWPLMAPASPVRFAITAAVAAVWAVAMGVLVSRTTLTVTDEGMIAKQIQFRVQVRWEDFEQARERRIGLMSVDEMIFRTSRLDSVSGRPLPPRIEHRIRRRQADRHIQVGKFVTDWQLGPIGRALREHEARAA